MPGQPEDGNCNRGDCVVVPFVPVHLEVLEPDSRGRAATLKVLSLGWGVQSWTLAAMVALKELPPVDYAVHADTRH